MRRWLTVLFAVTGVAFVAAWAATPLPRDVRVAAIDVGWLAGALLAGIACLWARRTAAAPLRRPYLLFGVAAFVWAAGQSLWTYQEIVEATDAPVFALSDVGFVLALPLFAAGVFAWPRDRDRRRLGAVLDLALVAGFAAFFGIGFLLEPVLEMDLNDPSAAYAALYPPSTLALFGAVLAAFLLDGWHERRRLELAALGFFAIVVGNAGYAYLGDAYQTGSFLDPLWALCFVAVGAAVLREPQADDREGWIGRRARVFLPALALALLTGLGVLLHVLREHDTHVSAREFFVLLALVLLLALRQGYVQNALLAQAAEQWRLEQQLEQSRKLDAVGRLAGGVAHDFNNLLTAIDGYTELAQHGLAPHHPAHADLTEVRRATQRASDLTRQLLVFSRRQTLAAEVVDLNGVVTGAAGVLRRLAGPLVDVDLRLDSKPAFVVADAGQLEQVVTNLVVNARDAMPQGGTVTVATRVTRERVALSVTDTGVGMTDEIRAKIFEPFFTTKGPGRGTGLGLAMVHGIVTQSGGELSVMTAPGRGSTFFVAFPASEAPPEPAPDPVVAPSRAGAGTVLLVEDEPTVRELARRILELAGFAVVTAVSGDDALDTYARVGDVDVLVTDIVMPGMRGDELARALLARRPGLPVVLMSGYSEESETIEALRSEGAVFVEKPFTSETLVAEVRGVLEAALA